MLSQFPGGWRLLLALIVSLVLTRIVIGLARRNEWVVHPKADRWHQTPTALYGGSAIFLTFAAGCGLLMKQIHAGHAALQGLIVGGALLFAVGLRDDVRALNPLVKLVGQVMAVTPFIVGMGLTYPTPAFMLSIPFILLWMLGLTNAFNLLDNMDGLSAGTATVVGGILMLYALIHHAYLTGALSVLLAFSCAGFLWFNFRLKGPARIFMGDCGSMFLGYMLAGFAVLGLSPVLTGQGEHWATIAAFISPLLIMALPIFDTTLVIILRKREGRSISQGGKDHSSHRLVYAGLTQKQVVLVMYLISMVTGGMALRLETLHHPIVSLVALLVCAAALAGFGIYLSRFSDLRQAAISAALLEQRDANTLQHTS